MTKNSSEKGKGGFRPGFSERFNYFLDVAKYPDVNKGRITLLAEDEEMSQSGVRKWIIEDNPPKGIKLIEICQRIINSKMSKKYNPTLIAGWLEYGDEIIPNPFKDAKSIAHSHTIMSGIYVLAHNIAKSIDIDIYSMEESVLDPIYKTIMDDVVNNELSDPDPELIRSLFIIARKDIGNK
jgi:hypothetical protein